MTAKRYFRKIIRLRAEDIPNVKTRDAVQFPGVLTYQEYLYRRKTWDPIRQSAGLDAEFYEGAEILMFPPLWLNAAEQRWTELNESPGGLGRPEAIGCDPGEGAAETAMACVSRRGLVELKARRTPDTMQIASDLIAFGKYYRVPPDRWMLDRGGGGKQIADYLRAKGYPVRTVGFGEKVAVRPQPGAAKPTVEETENVKEQGYEYLNRRGQMYGDFRLLLDPARGQPFALPPNEHELRRQLAPIPLLYDPEGRLMMLKKNRPPGSQSKEKTLVDLLGCSPDRADALVVALHSMMYPVEQPVAEVFG